MDTYTRLLTACRSRLAGLPELAGATVAVRKLPLASEDHGDTFPLVVLTRGVAKVAEYTLGDARWVDYPVTVTLFARSGYSPADLVEIAWLDAARQAVAAALDNAEPFSGVPGLHGCVDYAPGPPNESAALEQLLDAAAQTFTFRVTE